MIGLPSLLTFWISGYLYPVQNDDPMYQHFFLMGLVLWLYTVGPRFSILFDLMGMVGMGPYAAKAAAKVADNKKVKKN